MFVSSFVKKRSDDIEENIDVRILIITTSGNVNFADLTYFKTFKWKTIFQTHQRISGESECLALLSSATVIFSIIAFMSFLFIDVFRTQNNSNHSIYYQVRILPFMDVGSYTLCTMCFNFKLVMPQSDNIMSRQDSRYFFIPYELSMISCKQKCIGHFAMERSFSMPVYQAFLPALEKESKFEGRIYKNMPWRSAFIYIQCMYTLKLCRKFFLLVDFYISVTLVTYCKRMFYSEHQKMDLLLQNIQILYHG